MNDDNFSILISPVGYWYSYLWVGGRERLQNICNGIDIIDSIDILGDEHYFGTILLEVGSNSWAR